MKKFAIIIGGIFLSVLLFNSCEKGDDPKLSNDQVIKVVEMLDLYNSDRVEQSDFKSTKCHCLEVTYHTNDNGELWPMRMTLDFGEENCEWPEGIFRRGKIHVSLSDYWVNEGSVRTIEFEDHYINDINIFGTKTIENTGLNDAQHPTWEINIIEGGLKDTLGNEKTLNATLYGELIEGEAALKYCHKVYEITGSGSGTNNNVSFTMEIINPLRYKYGCWYPLSGSLEITSGGETVIIDYGDGECDNIATMQIGNADPVEITLGLY